MPSAICPYCGEPAFSSVAFTRVWTCPNCAKQVTPATTKPASSQQVSTKVSYAEQYTRFWTKQE